MGIIEDEFVSIMELSRLLKLSYNSVYRRLKRRKIQFKIVNELQCYNKSDAIRLFKTKHYSINSDETTISKLCIYYNIGDTTIRKIIDFYNVKHITKNGCHVFNRREINNIIDSVLFPMLDGKRIYSIAEISKMYSVPYRTVIARLRYNRCVPISFNDFNNRKLYGCKVIEMMNSYNPVYDTYKYITVREISEILNKSPNYIRVIIQYKYIEPVKTIKVGKKPLNLYLRSNIIKQLGV